MINFQIIENDGLPQQICTLCIHQANSAYYFILKCKESDNFLRQQIVPENAIIIDDGMQIEFIEIIDNKIDDVAEDYVDDDVRTD